MRPSVFWPLMVCVFLGLDVIAAAVIIYYATSDPTFAVEEGAYEQGLRWDDMARERAESKRLGWSATYHLGYIKALGGLGTESELRIMLTDSDGRAVTGASVRCVAFANVRSTNRRSLDLMEHEGGLYTAQLDIDQTGIWIVELRADLGAARFIESTRLVVNKERRAECLP